MKFIFKIYALIMGLCIFAGSGLYAQTTSGTDFWLAFGQNLYVSTDKVELRIQIVSNSTRQAKVKLTFTDKPSYRKEITVPAGKIETIELEENEMKLVYSEGKSKKVSKKSLHITSDQPVSIYAFNQYSLMLEASNVLPTNTLGTDYYHISFDVNTNTMWDRGQDAMTIIATEDNTEIQYFSKASSVAVREKLSKGQVWYVPGNSDMTGTNVVSNKPVAHFVTHKNTSIPKPLPNKEQKTENLFHQMAPVSSWGVRFFIPDAGQKEWQSPMFARIVASQNGTKIKLDGGSVKSGGTVKTEVSLNKGEFVTLEVSETGCLVSSNKPVGVCSYFRSYPEKLVSGLKGGPAMAWIPPIEQKTASVSIAPFVLNGMYNTKHFAILVTSESDRKMTTVQKGDGATYNLNNSEWFSKSGHSYTVYAMLTNEQHTFRNSKGLTALIYGISNDNTYYFLGGSSMFDLNMMFSVNGEHYKFVNENSFCDNKVKLQATIEYANSMVKGYLKWYIDGIRENAATDKPEWTATLKPGRHTIKMEGLDIKGKVHTLTASIIIDTPDISINGPDNILVGETTSLSPVTGGSWQSSNPAVASIKSDGTVTGISNGRAVFTFTSDAGCSSSCTIKVTGFSAVNDTVSVVCGNSVRFDALANDLIFCNRNLVSVDTIAGSSLRCGSLSFNSDATFTCKAGRDMCGIDSMEYSIAYDGNKSKAKIYLIVSKPLSEGYVACENVKFTAGLHPVRGVKYFWYDGSGKPVYSGTDRNEISVTKDASPLQKFQAEVRYAGKAVGRIAFEALLSEGCGLLNPTGCAVDGQLLFSEDFGGRGVSDGRIGAVALPDGTTGYTFKQTDAPEANEYALVKYINPGSPHGWQTDFGDHTVSGDKNSGYMLLINAAAAPGKVYENRITGLCGSMSRLYFSAWAANARPEGSAAANDPALKFELSDEAGNILETYIAPGIPRDPEGGVRWRNYGFTFNPRGHASLVLRIYSRDSGSGCFALDDIGIRFCTPPVTLENRTADTACLSAPYTFRASYSDSDGTFSGQDSKLAYRWEYSPDGHDWTVAGKDNTVEAKSVQSVYTIDNITGNSRGYYRFAVSSPGAIDSPGCRAVSPVMELLVQETFRAPDLRVMISPSDTHHSVYLTSFLDTTDITSVKWYNPQNCVPDFSNCASGELDAQKLISRNVYTYKYTATSKCNSSSARAYVLTSKDRLPVKNNREISVCRNMESSRHIQLNQILGLEDDGKWSYPDDEYGVVSRNVTVSSQKYAGARIFNARKAYGDALKTASYDMTGNPNVKVFKFNYESVSGTVYRFNLKVENF
ncbi:MAG: hypothetical protein LBK58_02490 [Prevotellaceae bacterium]|jgi:hypothetical protein|nr:hypothetical protein [Prevotellaceae bacterium]